MCGQSYDSIFAMSYTELCFEMPWGQLQEKAANSSLPTLLPKGQISIILFLEKYVQYDTLLFEPDFIYSRLFSESQEPLRVFEDSIDYMLKSGTALNCLPVDNPNTIYFMLWDISFRSITIYEKHDCTRKKNFIGSVGVKHSNRLNILRLLTS